MIKHPFILFASFSWGLSLSGCASIAPLTSFEPDADRPDIVDTIPEQFVADPDANDLSQPSENDPPAQWWSEFDDPVLNALITVAQAQNFDIQEARARLAQANAQARQVAAAKSLSVNGSVSNSYSDSPLAGTGFGSLGGAGLNRLEIESFTPSLGASYEFDLFGRIMNDTQAAKGEVDATAFDVQSLRQLAANEVISTYFDIVDRQVQIKTQQAIADLIAERLALSETRFARGLTESFEIYQLDQDLRNTRAGIPQQKAALDQSIVRLALLLGEYSETTKQRLSDGLKPQLSFDPISTPRPISLLDQRPDIQAAWQRAEAARRRVGARKAERYPSLSFTGSVGSQGADIAEAVDILDNWTLSLAQTLTGSLLDGGRTKAAITAAEAVYEERLATYAETVVRAHGEVETALVNQRFQSERYQLVFGQLEATKNSLETEMRRFERGTGTYARVLDAQRSALQSQSALSAAGRDLGLARLGVYRALGGDWGLGLGLGSGPDAETVVNPTNDDVSAMTRPAKG